MTNDRDPVLQKLFAESEEDLDGDVFTARVMSQAGRVNRVSIARRLVLGILLLVCAWFAAAPLLHASALLTQGLLAPLLPLESGLFTLLLAPVNSYAAGLALVLLVVAAACRRLFSSPC